MLALYLCSINYSFWSATFVGAKCVTSYAIFLWEGQKFAEDFLYKTKLIEHSAATEGNFRVPKTNTVEFVYNGFAYNVNSPTTSHFAWSRQNSYLLCTFRFAYISIAYNVNLNITAPLFIPQTYFVRLQRHSNHSSLAGTVECS